MNSPTILHINSSGRLHGSITRQSSAALVNYLQQRDQVQHVIQRDLASGMPFVDEPWIEANFTQADERTAAHKKTLHYSDQLVKELQKAQHIVIGSPIYNFNIPAVLKAWIDQIARANLTFHYTESGPMGLLNGKKATVVMASGGVPIGSAMDMASPYIKRALSFIGIEDVTILDAPTITEASLAGLLP